jgi:N-acetylglucosaminyl-diphospho-decaprenol L-rhamnosyltransferase
LHAHARAAPSEAEAGLTSIVVVSHDSGTLLLEGVAAALAQQVPVEVIVVDNASRDGSPQALPPDARLRVLRNADNPGFGAACNQGAVLARGDALLFLNPDCALPGDAVAMLRARLADDPTLGVLGAQLLNADGTPQAAARRRTPTPARALRRALGLAHDDLEMAPSAGGAPLELVDAISGALMLLPRRVFDALGGFDPGYRLHCEDLDLCRRALQAGHRVAIATEVRVLHLKGTSSRRRPVWVEWQKHRGMLRYFRKFDAAQSPWWLRLAVPLGVWLRFPLAALRAALRA